MNNDTENILTMIKAGIDLTGLKFRLPEDETIYTIDRVSIHSCYCINLKVWPTKELFSSEPDTLPIAACGFLAYPTHIIICEEQ